MTKLIYTKLPIERIEFLDRENFYSLGEKEFKTKLTPSIKKHGLLDPIYAEYGQNYGPKIKVIVGNNRMVVAKALGIKEVPIIVNIYTPETFTLEGRELKTDEEIKALFKLKDQLEIRRNNKGQIDQISPPWFKRVEHEYV